MATATIVVVILVAVGTVAAVAGLVLVLVRRLATLAEDIEALERRLGPALEELRRDADVTGEELTRVSAALDELARSRSRDR